MDQDHDSTSVKIVMKYQFTYVGLINSERIYGYQSKTERDYDRCIYYKMGDIIEYLMSHSHKYQCNYCSEILEMNRVTKVQETPQVAIRMSADLHWTWSQWNQHRQGCHSDPRRKHL